MVKAERPSVTTMADGMLAHLVQMYSHRVELSPGDYARLQELIAERDKRASKGTN